MQADYPWALLLFIPWAAATLWMYSRTPRLRGVRKGAAIAARSILLLIVIALIAGIHPYRNVEQRHVLFLADRSASMNADSEIGAWVGQAWQNKSAEDYGAILSIGQQALVDRSFTNESSADETSYPFRTKVNTSYTDIAQGLQLGSAILRDHGGGRMVLISDGSENIGDAKAQAQLLKAAGIAVDVVKMASPQRRDAAISELTVPSQLKQGEAFTFELQIDSMFAADADLRLFEDDQPLSVSEIHLEKGENRFALQSTAIDPGFHRFRAEIYVEGDEQSENNAAYSFSRISGPPSVLIVEGEADSSSMIESALTSAAILHETIIPEQLSQELAAYAAYDSIILNNVPATRIAEKPMNWLAKAVSDYGVGLMMVGGGDSYGLGGYFHTPVERALPVSMDLQGKKKIPSLGLVLVIDRSGSMSDGKLELAKEAAIRTVELLRDEDTVGVVAFDSSPWWVVEPLLLSNREDVIQKIQGIQAEGGTEIYSALDEGYKGLLDIDAQRKHIILLTDGQSSTNFSYDIITDAMKEHQMTLSTIAVGDGADQQLLQSLADAANGRFYFTKDQSTLPAIFSRETVMMTRTYIVDGTFVPSIGSAGDWYKLWQDGIPPINAYVAVTPKELAETALFSPDHDPILARWTYGSGRSIAWMSDLNGKWAGDWTSWPQFPKVFAEWVKWTFPQFMSSPYRLETELEGDSGKLIVKEEQADGGWNSSVGGGLAAGIQTESGEGQITRLMPVSPGRYEASIQGLDPGAYLAQIGTKNGTTITDGTTAGFVIPYSPEYRLDSADGGALLEQLAAITGGRVLSADRADEAFRSPPLTWKHPYDWSRELLISILLLWLLDIMIRRLSLPWHRLFARLTMLRNRTLHSSGGGTVEPSKEAASLMRLNRRTELRSQFHSKRSSIMEVQDTVIHTKDTVKTNVDGTYKPETLRETSDSSKTRIKTSESSKSNVTREPPAIQPRDATTVNRLLAAKNKNMNKR